MTLYPNHIDFPQLEKGFPFKEICTGTYSSQEIDYSKKLAVSAKIFYTKGRAVPWFNVVLNALKFSQIILMLPFLLMTLHFSQIGLTDDLTFTANPPFLLKVPVLRGFRPLSRQTFQKCPSNIIHRHLLEVNDFFICHAI